MTEARCVGVSCARAATLATTVLIVLRVIPPRRPTNNGPTFDAIAAELGDLPLALHLADTYFRRYRHAVTPAAYLAQRRRPGLLDHPSLTGAAISLTGHAQHVARTFALSYGQLDLEDPVDSLALELLARTACFAPGESIPHDLLLATTHLPAVELDSSIQVEDALARLVALGWSGRGRCGSRRLP